MKIPTVGEWAEDCLRRGVFSQGARDAILTCFDWGESINAFKRRTEIEFTRLPEMHREPIATALDNTPAYWEPPAAPPEPTEGGLIESLRGAAGELDEAVDHPAHYGGGDNPYEAIKVIRAWGLGFCLGNAAKYIARAGRKDPAKTVEDLRKARWYLDAEISELERTEDDG